MSKVRLEIMSWLSPHLGAQHSGRMVVEEEIQEGETVKELLNRLAARHKDFGELAFDTKTQQLTGNVNLVFNDRLIELVNGLDTRMKDGDTIVFLPAYAGGQGGKGPFQ